MSETKPEVTVDQLQYLIGMRVSFQGACCRIIEVLEDGPELVLQECDERTTIQPDQHGEAHRRVPHTLTIPIMSPDKKEFSPAFLSLDLSSEC